MDRTKPTGQRSAAGRWLQLLDACTDGLADGLQTHIPRAVGIVLNTLAVCVSLLLVHILLAVPMAMSGVGAGAGTFIYAMRALRFLRGHDPHR
ncbi:MAG TPA: hypothetical protein VHY18_09210 [Solirubrobacteraceae bacterium]|jgi:hypothetical protein|nr:hypothetical protein [Solirubrobacteraceae bacterium]